jgi:hypothetical protein
MITPLIELITRDIRPALALIGPAQPAAALRRRAAYPDIPAKTMA